MWFLCVCGFASVSLGVFACMCVCVYIGGGERGQACVISVTFTASWFWMLQVHVYVEWSDIHFDCCHYSCLFTYSEQWHSSVTLIFPFTAKTPEKKRKKKKDTHTYTHTHTHTKAHRKDPNINKSGAKVQRLETSFAYPGQTSFAYPGHLHACQNQRSCNWELV